MDKLLFFFFLATLLLSCTQKKRLSENDYCWMPYKGNETLQFESSTGNSDTVFLLKKDTIWSFPNESFFTGHQYQVVRIFCSHSDSVAADKSIRYLENDFCSIRKDKNNDVALIIGLTTKDAVFYRMSPINLDSLYKTRPVTLKINKNKYNDVFIINAEDYSGYFYNRSDYVTKIYWSKSRGLIRYDKKNKIYWALKE